MEGKLSLAVRLRPTYHNILMLDRRGNKLSTINQKRARWYLSRNLAVEGPSMEGYSSVIQLTFENESRTPARPADTQLIDNQCVCCGAKEGLSLHHVTPTRTKRYFKTEDKEHNRTLCVLLCERHHNAAEQHAKGVKGPGESFLAWEARIIRWIKKNVLQHCLKAYIKWWMWRNGSAKQINQRYIDAFLELKPKYLPPNWLDNS